MRWWQYALVACVAALAPSWAGATPRVAILPVVVHSASPNPSYLSDGLADMLAARLEQLGGMRVVREDGEQAATTRLDQAVARGGALKADYVVFGSFTQFGDGASLDLQCAPVESSDPAAARSLFVQSGAIGEIIPKLDDVADKVAYYVLGETAAKTAVGERTRNAAPLKDLVGRIDALERAVYGKGSAAAPKAAEAAAKPKAKPADVEENGDPEAVQDDPEAEPEY
jgi:TolB-like protein